MATELKQDDLVLFNPNKKRFQKTKEEVLENLRIFSKFMGNRPATRQDYKNWPQKLVSGDIIYRMFGSWQEACRQAGIPLPKKKDEYGDKELIDHFERVWRYFEQRPSIGNLKTYNEKFGTTITHDAYVRRWGAYQAFCTKFCEYKISMITFEELVKKQRKNIRVPISPRLRAEVLARDAYTCQDCGASPRKNPDVTLQIHHLIPVSKGGKTEEDNLSTNCQKCNLGKSDITF